MSDAEFKQDINTSTEEKSGFTVRAFVLGLLFALLIALIVPINIITVNSSEMATRAFPMAAAVILMFCIIFGNMLLKKIFAPAALRSKEILVVYIMSLIACVFPGIGLMMYIGTIAGPAQYGTTGNKYFETLYKGVDRLCIRDRESGKIRTLTKEELKYLKEAFTEEGSKKAFEREYFKVPAGADFAEGKPIHPNEYDSYEAFLNRKNFTRASWDHLVPFDTVETRSIEGALDKLNYMFEGFPPRYNGPGTFALVMDIWFRPLMWWTVFLLSLAVMVFCTFSILRKQWVEKERLLFPIMRVPLELVEGLDNTGESRKPLIKNRLLWMGALIPLVFIAWRYLAHHTGILPQMPTVGGHSSIGIKGGLQFPEGAAKTPLGIIFPVIGFTYLINLDVSFSLWFFHLLGVFETYAFNIRAIGTSAGGDAYSSGHSYVNHQSMGGVIALVLIGLFIARKHIFAVFRKAFGLGGRDEIDDSKEPLSYRAAVAGLILSVFVCVGWLVYAGMSVWVAAVFLALAMILYIGATRVICEGGIIFVQACMIPQTFMLRSFGAQALGTVNLVIFALSFMWMADFTSFLMPSVAHSMKLSDTASPKRKRWLFPAVMIVIAMVFFVTGAKVFQISYTLPKRGRIYNWYFGGGGHIATAMRYAVSPIDELNKTEASQQKAEETYRKLAEKWPFDNFRYEDEKKNELSRGLIADYNNFVKYEPSVKYGVKPKRWLFTLGGFGFMAFLMLMRNRFIWWPLHPIGFPFANSPATGRIWFSVLIGWLIKFMIIKYGGVKLFNKIKPVFIGIIVGAVIGIGTCYILDMTFFAAGWVEKGFSLSE